MVDLFSTSPEIHYIEVLLYLHLVNPNDHLVQQTFVESGADTAYEKATCSARVSRITHPFLHVNLSHGSLFALFRRFTVNLLLKVEKSHRSSDNLL